MSESQSRYSIVERLTEKKLSLIGQRQELQSLATEQREVDVVQDRMQYFLDHKQADMQRDKNQVERNYEETEQGLREDCLKKLFLLNRAKELQSSKEASIKEKILAIDEALKRVEEVSRNAGTGDNS